MARMAFITKFDNWKSNDSCHSYIDTSIGRYAIIKRPKRRLTLGLNGMIIGIHSDPQLLRRLAETDYKQRTNQHEQD